MTGPTISVTVIGGYLGAGKTTMVNHLLRTGDERMAVLVNDFGDINIDADLIARHEGDTLELANGCICCSLVDGFAAALGTIDGLDPRPERLIIETSGVADPATVAAYAHAPGLALDAVVVLVDAETIQDRATDRYVGDTVVGQLRSADLLVVNKVDLVPDADVARIEAWLAERNGDAAIVRATGARVAPELLFGTERSDPPTPDDGSAPVTAANRAGGHDPVERAHAEFESWSWSWPDPVDVSVIEAAMADAPEGVLRLKGVVRLIDDPRAHVVQRVGRRWSLRPDPDRSPLDGSQIVAIGIPAAIDDEWLAAHFDPAWRPGDAAD